MVRLKMGIFLVAFILGAFFIVGSSGNFNAYNSTRDVSLAIVPHEDEYMGFTCPDGYSAVVYVDQNSGKDFEALNVTNSLMEEENVEVSLYPDYSGLPFGIGMWIETDTGTPVTLTPGETHTFLGHVCTGNVEPGEYIVPMEMYATWDNGGASISLCPIKVVVMADPRIEKILLSGNTSGIPLKTYQEWVFQIVVSNPNEKALNLTIADTIPAEFNVSISRTNASSGNFAFWPSNSGHCNPCHHSQPSTKMEWNVTVPGGSSEHINVTIFTRVNGGNQQEFTSCGEYSLNDGARIVGYGIVSNGLWVTTDCTCGCHCGGCGGH
jgi:hypothetical protein